MLRLTLKQTKRWLLPSQDPFYKELEDEVPQVISMMLMYLQLWKPLWDRIHPPYNRQQLEAEDLKYRIIMGSLDKIEDIKEYFFDIKESLWLPNYQTDPSVILLVLCDYLNSLPEKLLQPKESWHQLIHEHQDYIKDLQDLRQTMSEKDMYLKILNQVQLMTQGSQKLLFQLLATFVDLSEGENGLINLTSGKRQKEKKFSEQQRNFQKFQNTQSEKMNSEEEIQDQKQQKEKKLLEQQRNFQKFQNAQSGKMNSEEEIQNLSSNNSTVSGNLPSTLVSLFKRKEKKADGVKSGHLVEGREGIPISVLCEHFSKYIVEPFYFDGVQCASYNCPFRGRKMMQELLKFMVITFSRDGEVNPFPSCQPPVKN